MEIQTLTEEEKKALRGSKFAPLPSLPPHSQPRLAHPGGAITTNKASALAKFLERKLQNPNGLSSLDPNLIELAVKNAKDSVNSSGASSSGRTVTHVDSFDDPEDLSVEEVEDSDMKVAKKKKKNKRKKDKKKNKKRKMKGDVQCKLMKKKKKLK